MDRERTTARAFIDYMRLAYRLAVYVPLTGMFVHWVYKGDKEDEATTDALLRHMAAGTVEELLGPIPLLREAGYSVADLVDQLYGEGTAPHAFKDPMDQPVTQIIKTLMKGVSEMGKLAFGQEARRIDVKDMILAIHMLKSIPGAGQIGATAQYWADVEMGLQKADTAGEMVRGSLFGKSNPEEPVKVPRGRSGRHWGR
jgi:hypothetical protein